MNQCKVTFENTNGQKVVVMLEITNENLEWKIGFQPKIDPKTDLGLAGKFAEIFCKSLQEKHETTSNSN